MCHSVLLFMYCTEIMDSWSCWFIMQNKMSNRIVFDSLRRDFIVAFGKWDFDPLDLSDPYPEKEARVHIWQGYEDKVVPFQLQRYVSEKLPWIRYHEVPDGGHLLVYDDAVCEAILRSLLLGEDNSLYSVQAWNHGVYYLLVVIFSFLIIFVISLITFEWIGRMIVFCLFQWNWSCWKLNSVSRFDGIEVGLFDCYTWWTLSSSNLMIHEIFIFVIMSLFNIYSSKVYLIHRGIQ